MSDGAFLRTQPRNGRIRSRSFSSLSITARCILHRDRSRSWDRRAPQRLERCELPMVASSMSWYTPKMAISMINGLICGKDIFFLILLGLKMCFTSKYSRIPVSSFPFSNSGTSPVTCCGLGGHALRSTRLSLCEDGR